MLRVQNLASLCNAAATALNLAWLTLCWVQDEGVPAGQANVGFSNTGSQKFFSKSWLLTMKC